jgi:putative intracellular protease/amidase
MTASFTLGAIVGGSSVLAAVLAVAGAVLLLKDRRLTGVPADHPDVTPPDPSTRAAFDAITKEWDR